MNVWESCIMNALLNAPYANQRALAEASGCSLGNVNRSLKSLAQDGYIDENGRPTAKALRESEEKSPRRAVILAAGFGMRMVPINMEISKGLLEVKGEVLIERTIRQLHEVGIRDIQVVVGFMKEQYEYLIDEFGVELVVNAEYAAKNNLHSMKRVLGSLSNAYVIPCDIWCAENPYRRSELTSWYMVSDVPDLESSVRVNRKMELMTVADGEEGNRMIGICYLFEREAAVVRERIMELCQDARNDGAFWEAALYERDRMIVPARVMNAGQVVEINTYEQLRELDSDSNHLRSDAIETIAQALKVSVEDITDIAVLKKGMTNRSFLFRCQDKKYIMRIPGEGTERLVNRVGEAAAYRQLDGLGICDSIVYINPANGYKITEYLENARACDVDSEADLRRCMKKLRDFHALELRVEHEFDIFGQIEFYERLWNGAPSCYRHYAQTKEDVYRLKPYIDAHVEKRILTHIDANPDNFLFFTDENGKEGLRLVDWEYAGMQDPHVDLAMFCIYTMYDRRQVDHLIDLYFEGNCPEPTRIKIYCYIAACGLLWSNWCEYKRSLGVEFGEYSIREYRYARDYYKIAVEAMEEEARR